MKTAEYDFHDAQQLLKRKVTFTPQTELEASG